MQHSCQEALNKELHVFFIGKKYRVTTSIVYVRDFTSYISLHFSIIPQNNIWWGQPIFIWKTKRLKRKCIWLLWDTETTYIHNIIHNDFAQLINCCVFLKYKSLYVNVKINRCCRIIILLKDVLQNCSIFQI